MIEPFIPLETKLASCGCAETRLPGRILPKVRFHDCEHIVKRNRLLYEADRFARDRVSHLRGTERGQLYTRTLSAKMEELCANL